MNHPLSFLDIPHPAVSNSDPIITVADLRPTGVTHSDESNLDTSDIVLPVCFSVSLDIRSERTHMNVSTHVPLSFLTSLS